MSVIFIMRVSGKERFTLTLNLNAIHWQIAFRIFIHFFRDNEILYCYIALNALRGSFFSSFYYVKKINLKFPGGGDLLLPRDLRMNVVSF